jgi:predicted nucleotidyltransferase
MHFVLNAVPEVPAEISRLLNALTGSLAGLLGAELVGVYLHGSLAMGCFNPESSDVDLLVVVNEKLPLATKQAIAYSLLALSDKFPKNGIELSIVTLDAVQQFQYPTPYELHFSEAWKARYRADAVNLEDPMFDPDLAAHFVVTINRGARLVGQPIREVFREIPNEFFLNSILNDGQDILIDIGKNPVYGVLNLCRILAYTAEKRITSKAEGGEWGLKNIAAPHTSLIQEALDEYRNESPKLPAWDKMALQHFAQYVRQLLAENTRVPTSEV